MGWGEYFVSKICQDVFTSGRFPPCPGLQHLLCYERYPLRALVGEWEIGTAPYIIRLKHLKVQDFIHSIAGGAVAQHKCL